MIFNAQLEQKIVTVYWLYDRDDHGIYNSFVDKVIYEGVDVAPILPDEVLEMLDLEGHARWEEQFHD
jgi:phosphopantetheine adenylyltransferase